MKIRLSLPALLLAMLAAAPAAQAHEMDCSQRTGIDRARCERHQRMFERCSPVKGEEHFVCDRELLLAHPLDCGALQGDDAKRCAAEIAAFKACEPQAGRAFMRCVRDTIKASPMGH